MYNRNSNYNYYNSYYNYNYNHNNHSSDRWVPFQCLQLITVFTRLPRHAHCGRMGGWGFQHQGGNHLPRHRKADWSLPHQVSAREEGLTHHQQGHCLWGRLLRYPVQLHWDAARRNMEEVFSEWSKVQSILKWQFTITLNPQLRFTFCYDNTVQDRPLQLRRPGWNYNNGRCVPALHSGANHGRRQKHNARWRLHGWPQ